MTWLWERRCKLMHNLWLFHHFPVHRKVLVLVLSCVLFCPSLADLPLSPSPLSWPRNLCLQALTAKSASQAYCPRVALRYRVPQYILRYPDSWLVPEDLDAEIQACILTVFSLVSFLLPSLLLGPRRVTWSHKSVVLVVAGWASLIKKIRLRMSI